MDYNELKEAIIGKLARSYGVSLNEASAEMLFRAVQLTLRDILANKRTVYNRSVKRAGGKRVYYLCIEFLMGRQMRNNLMNLGIEKDVEKIVSLCGHTLDEIYEVERDPALGNGGLGRLAACYIDSLTSCDYPATGHSILYEYGLFKQKIIDENQIELPDEWLSTGSNWLVPRNDRAFSVRFGGKVSEEWKDGKLNITHSDYEEVQAIPFDLFISGSGCNAVNILRLWQAKSVTPFNLKLFSQGEYVKAVEQSSNAQVISKVLYPADNHYEGKLLRLTQQYFLVSAAVQNIISDHLRYYGTLSNFKEKVAIHINDTHPAVVIPELMRILLDVYSYSWEDAWDTVCSVVSYTNHTVLPEALETWNVDLFRLRLPRIFMIITEINRRFCNELWKAYPGDWARISRMSIICDGSIRMANLCVCASHTINGVSELHSQILRDVVFHDFYKYTPDKFTNVTNGIAHRRWLCYSNPGLSALLDECIGGSYRKEPEKLTDFLKYKDDESVLKKLEEIKYSNKLRFADYAMKNQGIKIDPASLFDVQIKRMHEYKRQLLNCLHIIYLYDVLSENPDFEMVPRTFIFGAKAAPSYDMAKKIITLICAISDDIQKHPKIKEKLNVVFMEDYNVSLAEVLIPAAEISEQISLAGKEASGTGNMKLMINGALTVGTMDGANVEMSQRVGMDNIYIFGMRANEVDDMWRRGYNSSEFYNHSEAVRRTIKRLGIGFNDKEFTEFVSYLLMQSGIADPYMCLADFESYCNVQQNAERDYKNRGKWNRMSLVNIAGAGLFAADRAVKEYCDNIWKIKPIK